MPKSSNKLTIDQLGRLIYEIRGERVMLDSDLASIYGVETKALNRAVKRNRNRFPKDFVFQLSDNEWKNLRYQIGTSSSSRKYQSLRYQIGTSSLSHGGRPQPSLCFHRARCNHGGQCFEQPSSGADEYDVRGRRWMDCIGRLVRRPSVSGERESTSEPVLSEAEWVVRAFLKMRALLGDRRELAQKLASLEKELKKRLDVHEAVIVTILQRVMDIIDPPALPTPPPKPRIGFTP